jgi:hypothetical protein
VKVTSSTTTKPASSTKSGASLQTSSRTTSSSSYTPKSCPTQAINKGYKHELDAGPGCDYFDAEDYGYEEFYYYTLDPTLSQAKGVPDCAATCSALEDCQAFLWRNITNDPVPFYTFCEFIAAPYNASFLHCGDDDSQTVSLSVYSMTNWKQPAQILQNAGFETGCLFPWQTDFEIGNATDFYTEVIPCDRSVKGDCLEGDYYAHLYGGTPGVPKYFGGKVPDSYTFTVTLSNWPVTTPGVNYTISMWIKSVNGTGKIQINDGPDYNLQNPTGEWQQIETWFVADWGYALNIQARDPYVIDWYLDDVQVFESKIQNVEKNE